MRGHGHASADLYNTSYRVLCLFVLLRLFLRRRLVVPGVGSVR